MMRLALISALLVASPVFAGEFNEDFYNRAWCAAHGGTAEVSLRTGKRADCVTETHAVEADWTEKAWKEGVGQSLHYAAVTGKRAGIVVLVHEESRVSDLYVLEETIATHSLAIDVFVVDAPKD